jgi:hypothetical protein
MRVDPDLPRLLLLAILAFAAMRWAFVPGGALDTARSHHARRATR